LKDPDRAVTIMPRPKTIEPTIDALMKELKL
jgi:hypothetical protein